MPNIESAMRASRRRAVGEMMVESLMGLYRRDETGLTTLPGKVGDAKNTFSSWDNCMKKSYCKWPVIILIVVVSLMLLSILTCMVRCMCLGYSCCCTCFKCLSCCGCCHDCCDGKKNKPHKYTDKVNSPFNQQYASPAMMTPVNGGPPQYAQFEVGKNGLAVTKPVSEDALPPMPSWDAASRKHVLADDEKNNVEMGDLDPATGQNVPLMSGAASVSNTPSTSNESTSPYGARPSQAMNNNGYMSLPSPSPNTVAGGYRGAPGPGFPSPGPNRGYGPPSPGAMSGPPRSGSPARFQNDAYPNQGMGGARSPYPSPHATGLRANQRFPPQPQRQYSNTTVSSRPAYSERNYSNSSYNTNFPTPPQGPPQGQLISPPPARMPSPNGLAGFDFGPEVARKPAAGQVAPNWAAGAPSSQQQVAYQQQPNSAPAQQQERLAYPGYRPYQPQRQNTGDGNPNATPRTLTQGRGVQGWDPVQR